MLRRHKNKRTLSFFLLPLAKINLTKEYIFAEPLCTVTKVAILSSTQRTFQMAFKYFEGSHQPLKSTICCCWWQKTINKSQGGDRCKMEARQSQTSIDIWMNEWLIFIPSPYFSHSYYNYVVSILIMERKWVVDITDIDAHGLEI